MNTYVIGDVQGCFNELKHLLKKIKYNRKKDKIIFAGDIINKGPQSLKTINFIMSLGKNAQIVLGNHEILFLAHSYNYLPFEKKNTFNEIFNYDKLTEIQEWICNQKILIKIDNIFITHAGIPHIWSPKKSIKRAREIEFILKNQTTRKLLLSNIFNGKADIWNKELEGVERWICILNYFTRMRTITSMGKLNLNNTINKKNIDDFQPWFRFKNKKLKSLHKIIFGHWAAIKGKTNSEQAIALDTGCVFGGKLTCYCITTNKKYSVNGKEYYKI